MPNAPKRVCPGCRQAVSGPCLTCTAKKRRAQDEQRLTDAPWRRWYWTPRWRAASKAFLAEHPLCAECERHGRIEVATVVDHITPHRGDPALFWDDRNWQALSKRCHDRKTGRGG